MGAIEYNFLLRRLQACQYSSSIIEATVLPYLYYLEDENNNDLDPDKKKKTFFLFTLLIEQPAGFTEFEMLRKRKVTDNDIVKFSRETTSPHLQKLWDIFVQSAYMSSMIVDGDTSDVKDQCRKADVNRNLSILAVSQNKRIALELMLAPEDMLPKIVRFISKKTSNDFHFEMGVDLPCQFNLFYSNSNDDDKKDNDFTPSDTFCGIQLIFQILCEHLHLHNHHKTELSKDLELFDVFFKMNCHCESSRWKLIFSNNEEMQFTKKNWCTIAFHVNKSEDMILLKSFVGFLVERMDQRIKHSDNNLAIEDYNELLSISVEMEENYKRSPRLPKDKWMQNHLFFSLLALFPSVNFHFFSKVGMGEEFAGNQRKPAILTSLESYSSDQKSFTNSGRKKKLTSPKEIWYRLLHSNYFIDESDEIAAGLQTKNIYMNDILNAFSAVERWHPCAYDGQHYYPLARNMKGIDVYQHFLELQKVITHELVNIFKSMEKTLPYQNENEDKELQKAIDSFIDNCRKKANSNDKHEDKNAEKVGGNNLFDKVHVDDDEDQKIINDKHIVVVGSSQSQVETNICDFDNCNNDKQQEDKNGTVDYQVNDDNDDEDENQHEDKNAATLDNQVDKVHVDDKEDQKIINNKHIVVVGSSQSQVETNICDLDNCNNDKQHEDQNATVDYQVDKVDDDDDDDEDEMIINDQHVVVGSSQSQIVGSETDEAISETDEFTQENIFKFLCSQINQQLKLEKQFLTFFSKFFIQCFKDPKTMETFQSVNWFSMIYQVGKIPFPEIKLISIY